MPPKRVSDTKDRTTTKKARVVQDHTAAIALVDDILGKQFELPERDEDIEKAFRSIAQYVSHLRAEVIQAKEESQSVVAQLPKKKTKEELLVAAEKLQRAANAGIKKQMQWKPSCKQGSAKWSYDGVCPDPEVFGAMMHLGGPPTFKMKKYTPEEFEERIGSIDASTRYDDLAITGNVNVRWSDTGEFKFSGSYGAPRHMNKSR